MKHELHHCSIEGCKHADVPVDRVMCHKHWSMVPRDLQNSVYRWAKISSQRKRIQGEHLQAVRSAIESVNDQCRRERLREQGVKPVEFPVWFKGDTTGMR